MAEKAFQDNYAEDVSHCYGCGRLNEHGHQLKSYWDGEESVAHFTPSTLSHCHSGLCLRRAHCFAHRLPWDRHGRAAATRAQGRKMEDGLLRFVTAALKVDYLRPTPLGPALELRGRVAELKERKVVVNITVYADGQACAKGEVVAVLMPAGMIPNE